MVTRITLTTNNNHDNGEDDDNEDADEAFVDVSWLRLPLVLRRRCHYSFVLVNDIHHF